MLYKSRRALSATREDSSSISELTSRPASSPEVTCQPSQSRPGPTANTKKGISIRLKQELAERKRQNMEIKKRLQESIHQKKPVHEGKVSSQRESIGSCVLPRTPVPKMTQKGSRPFLRQQRDPIPCVPKSRGTGAVSAGLRSRKGTERRTQSPDCEPSQELDSTPERQPICEPQDKPLDDRPGPIPGYKMGEIISTRRLLEEAYDELALREIQGDPLMTSATNRACMVLLGIAAGLLPGGPFNDIAPPRPTEVTPDQVVLRPGDIDPTAITIINVEPLNQDASGPLTEIQIAAQQDNLANVVDDLINIDVPPIVITARASPFNPRVANLISSNEPGFLPDHVPGEKRRREVIRRLKLEFLKSEMTDAQRVAADDKLLYVQSCPIDELEQYDPDPLGVVYGLLPPVYQSRPLRYDEDLSQLQQQASECEILCDWQPSTQWEQDFSSYF